MPVAKAPPRTLKGVEIFQAGTWKGQRYTEADLGDMVRNFDQFSRPQRQLVKVPLVVGHEEDQALMDNNSGLPKDGTLVKLWKAKEPCRWCEGTGRIEVRGAYLRCPSCGGTGKVVQLRGDFADVPAHLARAIDERRYDKVSAEIYDEDQVPEGVPAKGMMLRRVAALGGELPHVKPLADLPFTSHAEGHRRRPVALFPGVVKRIAGGYQVFSEVRPVRNHSEGKMDPREKSIAALTQKGLNPEVLQKMDEAQLGECMKLLPGGGKATEEAAADDKEETEMADQSLEGATVSRPEGVAEYADCLRKMAAHGKKLFGDAMPLDVVEKKTGSVNGEYSEDDDEDKEFGEDTETGKPPSGQGMGGTIPAGKGESANHSERRAMKKAFSEGQLKQILAPMVAAAVASVVEQINPIKRDVQSFKEETKRQKIDTFVARFSESGHIRPWELDDSLGLPTLIQDLLKLDDTKPVHKFKEGTKTKTLTELDAALAKIERRPPLDAREKVKGGSGGKAQTFSEDLTLAEIKRFSEDHERELVAAGFTKEEFVKILEKAAPADRKGLLALGKKADEA